MAEKLDRQESTRALEILGRELAANRPTPRQERTFNLLNWDVLAMFLSYGVGFVGRLALPEAWAERVAEVCFVLAGLSILIMPILLLLNLDLVRKLWRNARMRSRLGLSRPLEAAFKAQRRKHRVRNLGTAFLAVYGVCMLVALPLMVWVVLSDELLAAILISLMFTVMSLSFASIHLIRRGMERMAVVETLHGLVRREESDAGEIELSQDEYDLLATMERSQIVEDRHARLERAAENPEVFGYAVQTSFSAQDAKSQLPVHASSLVDAQIQRLARDPESERDRVAIDEESHLRRLPVEGTPVMIGYQVDDEARVIRVVDVLSGPAGEASDPGRGV